jgi:stearoyl-CoA desaturase (delta-9 desaturase)
MKSGRAVEYTRAPVTETALDHPLDGQARVGSVRARTSFLSQLAGVVAVVVPPIGVLYAMGALWGSAFGLLDLGLMLALYVLSGLGITIGWHRYFSHKGFETTRAMRAVLAILGSIAMQGPLTQWVTDHRKHHALSDREGDPHSPHVGRRPGAIGAAWGLVHAHVGWLFHTKGMERGPLYAKDLYSDPMIRWIDRLYLLWVVLSVGVPFLIGWAVGGSVDRGVEAMMWAGLVRIFAWQHMTFAINSVCHMFGTQPYRSRDESRNVWPLAALSFGESWHNNHHAFPASARHGIDRFQLDLSWLTIRGLERLGLVWDVKRPTEEQKVRRRATAPRAAA